MFSGYARKMPQPYDHVDDIMTAWRRERPDVDPSPQGVIGRLHRLAEYLDVEVSTTLAEHGLSRGEFDVLATLRRAGKPYTRTAGDLAAHAMITSGGLTKRVDRLIERGLVERVADAEDARRRLIGLTPTGLATVNAAYTAHIENEHRLIANLGADAPQLAATLRSWLLAIDNGN